MTDVAKELLYHRKAFIAIEPTYKTSEKDMDDFIVLMNDIVERYNLKWCQIPYVRLK